MSLRFNELARRCLRTGPEDKVYQVVKLAMVIDALAAERISVESALAGVGISRDATSSPATRVSLNQIIECYRNANKLTRDPHFAYNAGLRFHFTDYGMYGFAMISSTNYRRTMQFAMQYHQLATPLAEIDLKEASGCGIWTITPMAHPRIDASLYGFLLEMQFGITVSLHRDFMGPSFAAQSSMSLTARRMTRQSIPRCLDVRCCSANPRTGFGLTRPGSIARRISETK
jgi:Arabinose-binding domain of AraC transcription regulator, N-term